MKRRISGMIVICMAMINLGSSICSAADVVIMYAIGLLDHGENAKVLTTEKFNRTATDYEKFRNRIAKAPTLKAMAKKWMDDCACGANSGRRRQSV